jgi:hypothetical protein
MSGSFDFHTAELVVETEDGETVRIGELERASITLEDSDTEAVYEQ